MKKEKIGLMMQYQKKNYNIFSKIDDCFPYSSEDEFKEYFDMKEQFVKLYCVDELNYEDKMPRVEAFENILTSIYNYQDYNFVYILKGNKFGIRLYLGLAKNIYRNRVESREDFANLIKSSIFANFPGTKFKNNNNEINDVEKEKLFKEIEDFQYFNMITGVPEFNIFDDKSEQNKGLFQGIDRLIRAMSNEEWTLMIVAENVNKEEILKEKEKIYSLYNELYPYSKKTIQMNESKSIGTTKGETTSENYSNQTSKNESMNKSKNEKESESVGKTESISTGNSKSKNSGVSVNKTDGNSETIDIQNKKIIDNLEYIDKKLIKRIELGNNRGFFKTAVYTFANENLSLKKLNSNLISIFQGESGDFSSLKLVDFQKLNSGEKKKLQKYLLSFQTFNVKLYPEESVYAIMNSIPTYISDEKNIMGLSTYLTAREISLLSGFPLKEVTGIKMRKGIDFGLNTIDNVEGILIGNIIDRGNKLDNNKIFIDEEHLNKHIFISGVTGSGKTTTSQKILLESKMPFLVIEPAKTEYRKLYNFYSEEEIMIYTLGSEDLPFRLNPVRQAKLV